MKDFDEITVRVFRDGTEMCALIGPDIMEGHAGFGESASDALRALADVLDSANVDQHRRDAA
jgi:hypothetical protein